MPVQRTFTLIPQVPGNRASPGPQAPIRPMTSKQVQKAYKAANRGPKLSRAEQRKQEKAEQERIRKEFEKEKAAAKARAAREKKKEKEAAEREEKRKKGLPTAKVRPSQDTIAWFVRGNGGRKRDSGGRELAILEEEAEPIEEMPPPRSSPQKVEADQEKDDPTDENNEDLNKDLNEDLHGDVEYDAPTKKRKIADSPAERTVCESVSARQSPPAPTAWTIDMDDLNDVFYDGDETAMRQKTRALRDKEEEEVGEPTKSSEQLPHPQTPVIPTTELDDLDDFSDEIELDMIENAGRLENAVQTDLKIPHTTIQEPSREAELQGTELDDFEILEDDFEIIETANLEEMVIGENADTNGKMLPPPRPRVSPPGTNYLDDDFGDDIEVAMQELDAMAGPRSRESKQKGEPFKFAIPDIPKPTTQRHPNLRHTTRYAHDLGLQRPVTAHPPFNRAPTKPPCQRPSHSPSPPRQAPPLSTQAILFNFDDFFPSPSQQVRELEEERLSQPSPICPPRSPLQKPEREPESASESALQSALHDAEQEQVQEVEPEPRHESGSGPDHEPEADPESESTSPSPPQRRFFTSSGSHELMALAIQRSRRTAALEQLHQREQARLEAGLIEKAEAEEKAKRERAEARAKALTAKKTPEPKPLKKPQQTIHKTTNRNEPPKPLPIRSSPKHTPHTSPANKENLAPNNDPPPPSASQETEYGGDWIDEMALELII